MNAPEILRHAADLVGGPRNETHGEKSHSFGIIARYWNIYLTSRPDKSPLSAHDVAMMMALLKVSRTHVGTHNPDDYTDGAGYLACAGEIAGG